MIRRSSGSNLKASTLFTVTVSTIGRNGGVASHLWAVARRHLKNPGEGVRDAEVVAARRGVSAGAAHTLADGHVKSSGSVAHDVASAQSAGALRTVPAASRDVLDEAVHAAAANGIAVLLAVAGLRESPRP